MPGSAKMARGVVVAAARRERALLPACVGGEAEELLAFELHLEG